MPYLEKDVAKRDIFTARLQMAIKFHWHCRKHVFLQEEEFCLKVLIGNNHCNTNLYNYLRQLITQLEFDC